MRESEWGQVVQLPCENLKFKRVSDPKIPRPHQETQLVRCFAYPVADFLAAFMASQNGPDSQAHELTCLEFAQNLR